MILLSGQILTGQDLVNHNLKLISQLDYTRDVSDLWGFVDESGHEYVVLGIQNGTAIIDLSDPENPEEISFIPGAPSIWRDFKSFGNFIYGVAEKGNDGLLIIDMSDAPSDVYYKYLNLATEIRGVSDTLYSAHNLFIDEKGWCYISGANFNNGGVVAVDILSDPWNPTIEGMGDSRYSHDNFVRGDTVWSADIYSGFFSVLDASDKTNMYTIITERTSFRFTHNCWLDDRGEVLYTTDEMIGAYVDIYDVSNILEIEELARYRTYQAEERDVVPHNAYYFNDYLYISYYGDGLVIVDVTRPDHPVLVASYDTYPGESRGLFGCWGVYPWFPSGILVASDIKNGLFVFEADPKRASYFSGNITNVETGLPVTGAKIEIIDSIPNEYFSDNSGRYKSGAVGTGTVKVIFSHPLYLSDTISLDLVEGELKTQDIQLTPLYSSHILIGNVLDSRTGEPIRNAVVQFRKGVEMYDFTTGIDGRFGGIMFESPYMVEYSKWGFKDSIYSFDFKDDSVLTLHLEVGYKDDFFTDQGWHIEASANTGNWVRDIPRGTYEGSSVVNPEVDAPWDKDDLCYMTGNGGGSFSADDVDVGETWLISPPMDLSHYSDPNMEFGYWYYNEFGETEPNDTLFVELMDNTNRSVHSLMVIDSTVQDWQRIRDLSLDMEGVDLSDVQIRFRIGDIGDKWHVVEAGIDAFRVYDGRLFTSVDAKPDRSGHLTVFPNPASDFVNITAEGMFPERLKLFDSSGRLIMDIPWNPTIDLSNLSQGIYTVQVRNKDGRVFKSQIIKKNGH
jgi:choice-of-anchor B domain-containing protein